ncbi:MAG: aryl-sulfate sulfotransferase [Candidatus Heimdallarchaeaceae archaeon]
MQIRKTALVSLLILFLSMLALNPQMKVVESYVFNNTSGSYSPVLLADDDFENVTQDLNLREYISNQVIEGLNYVPIIRNEIIPGDPATFNTVGTGSMVFDMDGNIINYFNNSRNILAIPYNSTTMIIEKSSSEDYFNNSRNILAIPYNSTTMIIEKSSSEDYITLFNLYTGTEEVLPIPGDVLDIVYNPITNTFLVLNTVISAEMWNGSLVSYQNIQEFNLTGHMIWEWDATTKLPFDSADHTSIGFNATYDGYADWMHANSIVWDFESDEILILVRNHDTLYNINKTDGNILWSAGRLGDFTVENAAEETVDTIWWHPYNLEALGNDRYIVFDNDGRNITNPDSFLLLDGYSRYLEFSINATADKISEEWSFTAPDSSYYSPTSGGDSNRLPNGNRLGVFGNRGDSAILINDTHSIYYTEVNSDGEIVWEIEMKNSTQFAYQSYMIERFYEKPFIELESDTFLLQMGQPLELNLETWDCMKYTVDTTATLKILEEDELYFEHDFDFLAFQKPTGIALELTGLGSGDYYYTIQIENADGIIESTEIHIIVDFNLGLVLGVTITSGVLILAASVLFIRNLLTIRKTPPEEASEIITLDTEETI